MQTELRVYLTLERLQRQFAAYLSSPIGGRGYVPLEGMSSLIIEIAPGLAIERVTDTALKAAPALEPGLLVVERQFGVLEVHGDAPDELADAGRAILGSLGLKPEDQLKPEILVMDVVDDITDRHAVIINRNKQASMVLPGESLLALELVPALFALGVLITAKLLYPRPRDLEVNTPKIETQGLRRVFWLYLAAVGLVAVGYADYPLIAYHFKKVSIASDTWIPIFYAVAMGMDALAALIFGRLFDKIGISVLVFVSLLSSLFAPLVFLGGHFPALAGTALWGVGVGAQESIMRAAVAGMVPADRRGTAYGVFNTGYGLLWFAGSVLMGVLYDISVPYLVAFSVLMQLASIPLFLLVRKEFIL